MLPEAKRSKINDTQMRCPRMHGFPPQRAGSIQIRFSRSSREWRFMRPNLSAKSQFRQSSSMRQSSGRKPVQFGAEAAEVGELRLSWDFFFAAFIMWFQSHSFLFISYLAGGMTLPRATRIDGDGDDAASCVKCRTRIPDKRQDCPQCGWTWKE